LNLLETNEPNDQEILNFEKQVKPKNVPFSLLAFLEVESKEFSSSETFLTVCKYLTTPSVLKTLYMDEKMTALRTTTNLLEFHPKSSELENLTFGMIQQHRLEFF
jgi:hypothetical protein